MSRLHEADQSDVLLAPLDRADVVAVQFASSASFSCDKSLGEPKLTDSLAE
jgi:hypothetical protein